MKNEKIYNMPYVGCLVGSAFQRMTSQLEAALKREGINITSSEYMILRALYTQDGLQQCDLSEMIGKDKASICRSVSSLSKKDLVSTKTVSYKCVQVWLTGSAREIQSQIMKIAEERHQELLSLATEKDIESFVKVLKAIKEKE